MRRDRRGAYGPVTGGPLTEYRARSAKTGAGTKTTGGDLVMHNADHSHGIQSGESPARKRPVGRVLSVRGSQTKVEFPAVSALDPEEARVTVGKFVSITAGQSLLLGVVTDVALTTEM